MKMAEEQIPPMVIKGIWVDDPELSPELATDLHVQVANDLWYLTFGQVRLPLVQPGEAQATPEIRAIARLVLSPKELSKIVALLKRVSDQVQKNPQEIKK